MRVLQGKVDLVTPHPQVCVVPDAEQVSSTGSLPAGAMHHTVLEHALKAEVPGKAWAAEWYQLAFLLNLSR